MSKQKKLIRSRFRNSVFDRDKHTCAACGASGVKLDAHHITDRTLMPNGGYVAENGISLCEGCHLKAEALHQTGTALPNYEPETLYKMIKSSYEKAVEKSKKLK